MCSIFQAIRMFFYVLRFVMDAGKNSEYSTHFATLDALLLPAKELLSREDISDVMINSDGKVWYEVIGGGLDRLRDVSLDPVKTEAAIHIIANITGRRIDAEHPSLACKIFGMGWNARVQANISPVVEHPIVSFRSPSRSNFRLDDLVLHDVLSAEQANLLARAVQDRKNIVVGGGTGSGKTTLSNALLEEIPDDSRLYIIEDTPELQISQANYVQILIEQHYNMRQAVVDAMRHRPDRIIVGEIRDGAALELLKSWNTGHPGGLATLHANSAQAILVRLKQLVQEAVITVPEGLVEESVHVAVFLNRIQGKRVVEHVYVTDR